MGSEDRDMASLDPYYEERRVLLAVDELQADYDAQEYQLGDTPRTWRQLLHYAIGYICPNGECSDIEYLADFEQHFGPCSTAHLAALARRHAGTYVGSTPSAEVRQVTDVGDEIHFVLLMLGVWPEHPQADLARSALVEYLASPELRERLECAISLSHLRDKRAVPALLALLTDGLPDPKRLETETLQQPEMHQTRSSYQSFDKYRLLREEIPELLVRWKAREAIPALRHALALTVQIEREEARRTLQWRSRGHWRTYQWDLVIALGRFSAFGALTEIEPPEENMWRLGVRHNVPEGTREPIVKGDPKQYLLQQWQVLLCYEAIHQRFEDAGRHGTIAGHSLGRISESPPR